MRSDKRGQNVDPKPMIMVVEPGTYCLMAWEGPCDDSPSKFYATSHNCTMGWPHKSRHQCSCGVSRMKQKDDPSWEDK